jgi:hypothetical protein
MGRRVSSLAACALLAVAASVCTCNDRSLALAQGGAGGRTDSCTGGGAPATGGNDAAAGGATGAGGEIQGGATGTLASGGGSPTGGVPAAGGAIQTGGMAGSGGITDSGGTQTTTPSGGAAGTTAAGGSPSTGGTAAAGGSVGTGGTPGTGGATAAGGTTGTTSSGGATATCGLTPTASTSPKIPTVGIVTWTTSLPDIKAAHIDFGLTPAYGMTAPVDITANDHRTLLLGMKPGKTYHYRIVASNQNGDCASDDYTITAGFLIAGLPRITVATKSTASPSLGGYLLAGEFVMAGASLPAYIVDADGDLVWAYVASKMSDTTSARMDYAGTHVWINSSNKPSGGSASVHRVSMDGLTDEDLSSGFAGLQLQLTVLPDETVAFFAANAGGCPDIKERSPAGSVTTIANAGTAQGVTGDCEVWSLQHSRDDDTLVFSDMAHQSIVKVRRRDGATLWVLGGSAATFTGTTWQGGQAGLHVLAADRLLFFGNNSKTLGGGASQPSLGGAGDGSLAIELALDLAGKQASQVWAYKASPGIQNDVMGDVQRLPNGNTIVAYSSKGVLHEVDASGTLLQEWTWSVGMSFGYVAKRASLYGPPPR